MDDHRANPNGAPQLRTTLVRSDASVEVRVGIASQEENAQRWAIASAWVTCEAWKVLPATAKAVALPILDASVVQNCREGPRLRAWPRVADLSRACGLSARQTQEGLKQLRSAGIIHLIERGGGHATTTTSLSMYELRTPPFDPDPSLEVRNPAPVRFSAPVKNPAPVRFSAPLSPNVFGSNSDSSVFPKDRRKTDDVVVFSDPSGQSGEGRACEPGRFGAGRAEAATRGAAPGRLDFELADKIRLLVEADGSGDPDIPNWARSVAELGDLRRVVIAIRNANSTRSDNDLRKSWTGHVRSGIVNGYPLYERLRKADERAVAAAVKHSMFPPDGVIQHAIATWGERMHKVSSDTQFAQVLIQCSGVLWLQTPKPQQAVVAIAAAIQTQKSGGVQRVWNWQAEEAIAT